MARVIRILLTWLLATAIPLQGYATTAMANCGLAHEGLAAAEVQPEHAHHAAHHHDGRSQAHVHDLHKMSKSSCSVCASCCAAVAIPAMQAAFQPPGQAQFDAPAIPQADVLFLTDAPERPPRQLLA